MKQTTIYYFCKAALEDGSVAFWKVADELSYYSYDGKLWTRYGNECPALNFEDYKKISKRKFEEISFVENI